MGGGASKEGLGSGRESSRLSPQGWEQRDHRVGRIRLEGGAAARGWREARRSVSVSVGQPACLRTQLEGLPHPPARSRPLCLVPSSRVLPSPVLDSELRYLCPWHWPQARSQHLWGARMGEWVMAWIVISGGQSSAGRGRGWQVTGALWGGLVVSVYCQK